VKFTLFTCPKGFDRFHIAMIQRNAIQSWLRIDGCEVLLLGSDPGVAAVAESLGVRHIPVIAKREGIPLVSDIWRVGTAGASHDIVGYCNADVCLGGEARKAIRKVDRRFESFLVVGRRWDWRSPRQVNFSRPAWSSRILASGEGEHHNAAGIDYFIFTRGAYGDIPDFMIGCYSWDNWLLLDAMRRGIPTIDATKLIHAIHQAHPTDHSRSNKDPHRMWNLELARPLLESGGRGWISHTSHVMRRDGEIRLRK
jgi:hypothetical protein